MVTPEIRKGNKRKGMIMLYCDPPSYHFWAPFSDNNNADIANIRENLFAKHFNIECNRITQSLIIDWNQAPNIENAVNHWTPSAISLAKQIEKINTFSLKEGEEDQIYVCGDCYSLFQGYIEGALRTVETGLKKLHSRT